MIKSPVKRELKFIWNNFVIEIDPLDIYRNVDMDIISIYSIKNWKYIPVISDNQNGDFIINRDINGYVITTQHNNKDPVILHKILSISEI